MHNVLHPEYTTFWTSWFKWRLAYKGGRAFIENYLKQSARESYEDYVFRKAITYSPSFAKAAVNEIKNAVFQRMPEIVRRGGPGSYQLACRGDAGGVDRLGSSMMSFMGCKVLPELLSMNKVGIWVDMPQLNGETIADKGNRHPYVYVFWAEDIRSWALDESSSQNEFKSLLLREWAHKLDPVTGYPVGETEKYRDVKLNADGFVEVVTYDSVDNEEAKVVLPIRRIPFIVLELGHSLLEDVAEYQIAMLNMASSDVTQAVKANFPMYTEQQDTRVSSPYVRKPGEKVGPTSSDVGQVGTAGESKKAGAEEVRWGVSSGRRYPIGAERPGFIHPSSEPLRASMDKQQQMKAEIRQLVHLAVTSLDPKLASAESKGHDERGLEAGLAAIGLVCEVAERRMAEFWAIYEGVEPATVRYPTSYSLQTDADRRKEASDLAEQMPKVPSLTFQREIAKEISHKLLGHKVPAHVLEQIDSEVDAARAVIVDPKVIVQDVEHGIVSAETAAEIRGYGRSEAVKAQEEHARRVAVIAASQADAAARGISDLSVDALATKKDKEASRNVDGDAVPRGKMRGEGR